MLDGVLELYPANITADELMQDVLAGEPTRGDRIEVDLGIRELVKAGLLHACDVGHIAPTRAAVYYSELQKLSAFRDD